MLLQEQQHLFVNNSMENTIINNYTTCHNSLASSEQPQLFLTEITNSFSNNLSLEIGKKRQDWRKYIVGVPHKF